MLIINETPPLVAVYWSDAHSYNDELEVQELKHDPVTIITYGFLLIDDEKGISLACEQTGPKTFRGHTFILRSLINKVKVIRKNPFKYPND